jgi:lipopolysaccharide transport system ATP-binding protein
MYTRLAFAVAAHLEPEILIVDEVLAVGDAQFQQKCLGKMGEVARGGRTVLFVSHNMHAVNSLCSRGLVLDRGRVIFDGTGAASVAEYLALSRSTTGSAADAATRPGSGEWRFTAAAAAKPAFDPAEPKEFAFRVEPASPQAGAVYLSGLLSDNQGRPLAQLDSRLVGQWLRTAAPTDGRLRIAGMWLKPGRYALDLYVCTAGGIVDWWERAVEFEVTPVLPYPQPASPDSTATGLLLADFGWRLGP